MTTETKTSKTPTHEIFHVVGEGDKARWSKLGIGWTHKDGDGMNLIINYSPLIDGNTVVRKVKPKQEYQS